jgi:hypothetical protein
MTSFSASFPRQILLDSEKKIAVNILFLYQFLWDMHQSTGDNISFPQNIESSSVYKPFYQTLCITLEVACIRAGFSCKLFRFLALSGLRHDYKVRFTSTASTEGKTLPKYVHIFIMNGINLTFFFNC